MKTIFTTILCLFTAAACSQDLPNSGFDKVRIIEAGKVIQAEIKPVSGRQHLKKDLFYAWYAANTIHSTQGGYSGRLLNGQYNEFYLNKNLREQGFYKNGLKTGAWKRWKEDGALDIQTNWKNGTLLPDSTVSFWKKLPLIRRRKSLPELPVPNN